MHLNEFTIGVIHSLLEKRGLRRSGADNGVCRAAETRTDPACANDSRGRCEGVDVKSAAVNGGVKMFGGSIAFAFLVFCGVDAGLRADRMRALYRYDGKQVHGHTGFGNANRGHQSGQSSAYYDNFWLSHRVMYEETGCQSKRKLIKIRIPMTLKEIPKRAPNCPAARCARTVAASPHLQRKFQMPTPR